MQMSEECEQVLQKMDDKEKLTDQIIADFEESRVTRNDSFNSVTKHNILNDLEE